jgi:hypothetical protein
MRRYLGAQQYHDLQEEKETSERPSKLDPTVER